MGDTIRIRATCREGLTTVRTIIRHPMHNGLRTDPDTGEIPPAHFIEEVTCLHGDRVVLRCLWSRAVSRNPYLSFSFTGAQPGDPFSIEWVDNLGERDRATVAIG